MNQKRRIRQTRTTRAPSMAPQMRTKQKNQRRKSLVFIILRRDWDSNPGTKILGHSLAGCCITTLPPLHSPRPLPVSGRQKYVNTWLKQGFLLS
jgi:hypothetical protein